MKPEQRPCTEETREPKNASPRRVPLNAMLGCCAPRNINFPVMRYTVTEV